MTSIGYTLYDAKGAIKGMAEKPKSLVAKARRNEGWEVWVDECRNGLVEDTHCYFKYNRFTTYAKEMRDAINMPTL